MFARFLTIYDPYVFKFADISQSLSHCLNALRGSVAVVWHDRLSVDVSYSSAARDLLTTLMIGSSLLWEMMLWLSVSVI